MNLETEKKVINKSSEETFHFLNNVENYKKLMPDSIEKFEVINDETFLFSLKGMPEIILKKKETIPHSKIVFGAAGGKIDFSLVADIESLSENSSEVQLGFNGDFNPMMAMMIKTPIKNFINTLSNNIPEAI